jgi:hypothetical protein
MASASPGQTCAKCADKPGGARDGTEAFAHAGTNIIFDDGGSLALINPRPPRKGLAAHLPEFSEGEGIAPHHSVQSS